MVNAGNRNKGERHPAAALPVARVYVDVPLAHLDKTFDYLIPAQLDEQVVPGCRIRVRFSGRLVDAYVIERAAESEHPKPMFLEKVVSSEPVLAPQIAQLARTVADRYAGTMMDVLRLAIPPRHARAEAAPSPDPVEVNPPEETGWGRYPRGPAFLDALKAGRNAHAVWQALPNDDWPRRLAELATTVAATGRGVVMVVPDYRDVARLHAACLDLVGKEQESAVVALSADLGPSTRYKRWLAVLRGSASIVLGTRATAFAPVKDPGLVVIWDDGDDLHADQRSPYAHVRDVLTLRAHQTGAAMVIGGFARTSEAQLLLDTGWAHEVIAARDEVRKSAPRVTAIGETDVQLARDPAARAARLPSVSFEAARHALTAGAPVLVQVPRRGYVPALACAQCRAPARCRRCAGPLSLPGGFDDGMARPAACRWCGAAEAAFRCGNCGSRRLRAVVVGSKRTAEELGRAFPGVPVRTSGADEVLATVSSAPALVVSTPGAEPVAEGGYGAALLLDSWALLGRADLRATEETLRRWMGAAALVRPGVDGGRVVVVADSSFAPVQALVRWDPAWHATQELAARSELGFPPAVRMASVDGSPDALAEFLDNIALPESAEVLGPVPIGETNERALIRTPRVDGRALAAALAVAQKERTARKEPESIRIRLDPLELV
ncbi:primosomal protein N' [Kibdelosporangium philippinense]|uniref:Probable replication restart protein PriA n=1 Tax=Kibdelosporangium philippinense TaxID=211113 RepID=A0ABS8ZSL6_9PSEU|nr:primosomal protein N' [Kibdelosporangium philippinense]MCE7010599.1 primosomal protein N' [Kibdelosporangium philippinense]